MKICQDFFITCTTYFRNVHDGMAPPNNWSGGGGSAWERSHARKQFYFHRFSKGQPDFNWRNPAMEEAMLHVYAELARVDCLAAFKPATFNIQTSNLCHWC
jgi:glycosidase